MYIKRLSYSTSPEHNINIFGFCIRRIHPECSTQKSISFLSVLLTILLSSHFLLPRHARKGGGGGPSNHVISTSPFLPLHGRREGLTLGCPRHRVVRKHRKLSNLLPKWEMIRPKAMYLSLFLRHLCLQTGDDHLPSKPFLPASSLIATNIRHYRGRES
jgi:hypothetical protein